MVRITVFKSTRMSPQCLKSPEIKPSTTDEDAECSRRMRILADTFHGCLHSNWIPLAIFFLFFLMRKLIDNFSTHSTFLFYNEFFNPHSVNRISGGCFPPIFEVSSLWIWIFISWQVTVDELRMMSFSSLTKRNICIIRWWKFKKSTVRRNRNRRWKEEIFTWNLTFCVYQSQSQIAHDLTLFTLILWLLVLLIDRDDAVNWSSLSRL